ncbi:hypothetical protein SAMN05192583_0558 [Sphingomonas gellani]|uniref:Uncharacterized protein n=1 Tax=Sphingomonas gellani TaxID=1166340 RepID=A0A1H7Z6N8_9SPHN|nr:hypothetical protein [Sphingomonas gellani]SEM53996.1 hypothetical protein SAMN05192583_0558 [Sphingomonas gellani]
MTPGDKDRIHDSAVACRQVAELLDTVVDALDRTVARDMGQLIDSLAGIGRLARYTAERLEAVAA